MFVIIRKVKHMLCGLGMEEEGEAYCAVYRQKVARLYSNHPKKGEAYCAVYRQKVARLYSNQE